MIININIIMIIEFKLNTNMNILIPKF